MLCFIPGMGAVPPPHHVDGGWWVGAVPPNHHVDGGGWVGGWVGAAPSHPPPSTLVAQPSSTVPRSRR